MIRLLNKWEMTNRIQSNCKIFVKTFSGATVSCMEDYTKPSLRNSLDNLILHVVTSDLFSEKSSMENAESIINLVYRLKNEMYVISVSAIILRTDNKKLKEKEIEVNLHLKEHLKKRTFF